jgi:flagellar basal body-associated protein FliL
MIKIEIEIDVWNSEELVKEKKGAIIGTIASWFAGKKFLKSKVEEKMANEIVRNLHTQLNAALDLEGVKGNLRIKSILHEPKEDHEE